MSFTGAISSAIYTAAALPTVPAVTRTRLDLSPESPAGRHTIVLEANSSDGATSATNVTYTAGLDLKQEQGVPLPYSKEISADEPYPLSLWVQNAGEAGTVRCRIKVDGQVVREVQSQGPYGVCNVRADAP